VTRWHELAPGVRISAPVDSEGVVAGWIIEHETAPSEWCGGWVPRLPSATNHRGWNTSTGSIETADLTLSSDINSQSIQCHTHKGFHGFVRDGHWVPA
jgi:hypothetical protein